MVKILIFGFPHCGTTMLRAMFGNNDTIYEIPEEAQTIPAVINNDMNKEHIIIKWPWTCNKFFKKEYNEYIKIFILRNPYYVFSSLNSRFNSIPIHNRINKYLETARLFIKYKDTNTKNLYCIKYEDIFKDNFDIIKKILNENNIVYDDTMFINNNIHYINKKKIDINNLSINPKDHIEYRTWQVNKPFIYNDTVDKLNLYPPQENTLNNSKILEYLEYYNPKYRNNIVSNTILPLEYTITKIFVIHLKSSIERNTHLVNEFKRMNITNYEIFDAVTSDSDEVKEKFNTGFVKKPPCFRCNLPRCNHANKVLQDRQIGNWCSFINIMKKIVDEQINGLIMICEDDIKFMDNYHTIMNKLVSKELFNRYNININNPILLRLGNSLASDLDPSMNTPILIKKITMSNPCFLINRMFAETFITNLKCINTTSDIFIHKNLINKDKNIQAFTLIPQIAHELSYGKYSIFKSEIRK